MMAWAMFAGWILFVVLWETTAIAVALAAVRLWTRRRTAASEHAAALAAFLACVAGAGAVPVVLASQTGRATLPSALTFGSTVLHAADVGSGGRLGGLLRVPAIDTIAVAAATAWAAAVVVLWARLAGGWWVARSMIGKAHPLGDEFVRHETDRLAERAGLPRAVRVLESSAIETPVVVGWRAATLLVPRAALAGLSRRQITAVLAHEVAHIRRHDYLVNLLQSVAEIPLFFSPAAGWISRALRQAREFCCDDEALANIGDRRQYVDALIALAASPASTRIGPSIGVSGPGLVTRVRRLLQEDSMPRFIPLRVAALVCAFVLTILTGVPISSASALRFPSQANSKVYRIGDPGVKAPVPTTRSVKATYTKSARKRRIEGTVDMEEVIRADGTVHDVRVVTSLDPGLDAEAVKAAKRWRFQPATKDGTPVNVMLHMEMTFTLK